MVQVHKMDFNIPKTKREYETLSFDEKQLITYLFSKRAIQVTQELQSFTFGISPLYKSVFEKEKIEDVFRVLSYTPMKAMFLEVREEYEKALSLAHVKIKSGRISIVFLGITAMLIFTGVFDLTKAMGG